MAGRSTSAGVPPGRPAADIAALRGVIGPVARAVGLDLEDVEIRRAGSRSLLRVLVDADGGITLDRAAEAARLISEALDASEVMGERAYVLDVGSPGVDRPLLLARHWRRNIGRTVRAVMRDGRSVTGRILAVDAESDDAPPVRATLDADGVERTLVCGDIRRAVVQVDFSDIEAED